jgi:chromosome segregation ATPase
MAAIDIPIGTLRERLTQLLADWGAEMSMVLKELEDTRAELAALEQRSSCGQDELERFGRRLEDQESLIESLEADAAEAKSLRAALSERDRTVEKLTSDLEGKHDVIKVLRKDADKADGFKQTLKRKDQEIGSLAAVQRDLELHIAQLERQLDDAEDAAAKTTEETTELAAVRAELDAKNTLIHSLRTDSERFAALEGRLGEKRAIISKLEETLERQAATIAELKHGVSRWKEKYNAMRPDFHGTSTTFSRTMPDIPVFDSGHTQTETDLDRIVKEAGDQPDRTIAINMRDALREAREASSDSKKEKLAGG